MRRRALQRLRFAPLVLALLMATAPARGGVTSCAGDCDGDKTVSVAELITMVNIALGKRGIGDCKNGDRNDDGAIDISELIRAVGSALDGCDGGEPKPFKTSIDHPFDPYLAFSATQGGPSWVKFTIRVAEPGVVYFQNSSATPFHQDFVSTTLEPYIGWTAAEIDAVSLHADGQELVFGAVLYSPTEPYEIAIQLVRQDAYSAAEVITYFAAARASVNAAEGIPFFYFPTFEQQESAAENRQALEAAGIPLGSTARWLAGDVCYALGWAQGRLVFVAGDEIEDAYADGTIGPNDILLTDGVPAEIPFVAGVLSLAPSTPSSHVAILAGDWEIPFAFLAEEDSAALAQALVGRDVVLRATTLSPRFFTGTDVDPNVCQIRLVDVTDTLDEQVVAHLRELKQAPDLQIRPFVLTSSYPADVDTATPDAIVTIGGKAANYGFIRRAIAQSSRPAVAFSFDLWNDYLDQVIDGGPTLRERIAALLAPFPTYPPADFAALFDALDDARDLIDDVADFTPAQRSVIIDALQGFDAMKRIRFRSSTNVEDSDVFTGAGLYESESGCLADDVDGDDEGPSLCDPTRSSERGVFRALRKVFQSFYNDNAYLERLRHHVDESQVGMAVLVHHTFVDEDELANGVATLHVSGADNAQLSIVTQPGAFSVTNPEDGGLPEVVEVFVFRSGIFPNLRQQTDRLPLGATVLQMPQEYTALSTLLLAVGDAFGEFHGQSQFDIEFEFKKMAGGEGLIVKQVRRIPRQSAEVDSPPVLIDVPTHLCTFQGEYGDVFANYRLKSRWSIDIASGTLAEGETIFRAADHRHVVDGTIAELTGAPSAWPEAQHGTFDPQIEGVQGTVDSWRVGIAGAGRTATLRTLIPERIGPAQIPIVFPDDLGFSLEASHDTSVPFIDFEGSTQLRRDELVQLVACSDETPLSDEHLLQSRHQELKGVRVDIGFYWPPYPTGAVAGYTAPVDRWTETSVEGIGASTALLRGYFSQTYRPEHHNFTEGFIFDPHLEEGIDAGVVAAWDTAGIQALVVPPTFTTPRFKVLTMDDELIDLPGAGSQVR